MWLGTVCTCLPILYPFYRIVIQGRKLTQQGAYPAQQGASITVQDPNSGYAGTHDIEDSAYHTGNATVITSGPIDLVSLSSRSSNNHEVQAPASTKPASTKSLLVSAERCEDLD